MKNTSLLVAMFVIIAITSCQKRKPTNEVESEALDFATKMSGHVNAVQCMNIDSDNDGYVTCTVFMQDREPFSLQCAQMEGWEGCKTTVPKMTTSQ